MDTQVSLPRNKRTLAPCATPRAAAPRSTSSSLLETILRCFQAGVSASATYAQGGFDTHSQHDGNRRRQG